MVARKKPGEPSTELANFDEELARRARGSKKLVADVGVGKFISTQGGTLAYNGADVPGNSMHVVVISEIYENTYYAGKFDPDSKAPPTCYAFGQLDLDEPDADVEMKPHEKAMEPQNDTCKGCPWAEWGSSDTGRGKACQNRRRLALFPADELDNVKAAQVAYLKVPVTSVAGWAQYVRSLDAAYPGKPPFCFVTELAVVPDKGTQFKVTFKLVDVIDAKLFRQLIEKQDSVKDEIVMPYPDPQPEPEAPARGRTAAKIGGGRKPAAPAQPAPAAARGRR